MEPHITVVDTLRESLNLTGSKKGCNYRQSNWSKRYW